MPSFEMYSVLTVIPLECLFLSQIRLMFAFVFFRSHGAGWYSHRSSLLLPGLQVPPGKHFKGDLPEMLAGPSTITICFNVVVFYCTDTRQHVAASVFIISRSSPLLYLYLSAHFGVFSDVASIFWRVWISHIATDCETGSYFIRFYYHGA